MEKSAPDNIQNTNANLTQQKKDTEEKYSDGPGGSTAKHQTPQKTNNISFFSSIRNLILPVKPGDNPITAAFKHLTAYSILILISCIAVATAGALAFLL